MFEHARMKSFGYKLFVLEFPISTFHLPRCFLPLAVVESEKFSDLILLLYCSLSPVERFLYLAHVVKLFLELHPSFQEA